MPISLLQERRNAYAAACHRNDSTPADIERARLALEVAKAEHAIASWTALTLTERTRLAALLVGNGDAA